MRDGSRDAQVIFDYLLVLDERENRFFFHASTSIHLQQLCKKKNVDFYFENY